MITLPDNFLDTAYVDTSHDLLLLHFKNRSDQYFTHIHRMDHAFSLDEHLETVRTQDLSQEKAYMLDRKTLEHIKTEPLDQDWVPAPVPFPDVVSLSQYRALKGLPQ